MTTTELERPKYGNWTKPKSPGLPWVGLIGSAILVGDGVIAIFCNMFAGWKASLVWLLMSIPFILPLLYKNKASRNGWQIITTHVAWYAGRKQGQQNWRACKVGQVTLAGQVVAFGSAELPGSLAKTTLYTADANGVPFSMLNMPQASHYTVYFTADPEGSALVDPAQIDRWVYFYGQGLAELPYEPGLVGMTVIIETAPDHGDVLKAESDRLTAPRKTPDLTKRVLGQTTETYPRGSANIAAYLALTYSAKQSHGEERELFTLRSEDKPKRGVKTAGEMAALIGGRIPGLVRAFTGCGGGTPRPMTVDEVCEMVRVAYDPDSARTISAARAAGEPTELTWDHAGPTAGRETWSRVTYDSGHNITWEMVGAPPGTVESQFLEEILGPCDATTRKRVAILYRPHDAASAPGIADRDVRTAINKASRGKGETKAHQAHDLAAARQTAAEEAAGAGMTRAAILVTATVTDEANLAHAADVVSQLGRASRLRLRRCYGAQSAAFITALGLMIPTDHVQVPEIVRTWM